jgi:uncharacterized protein YodC (DUF2158 family)
MHLGCKMKYEDMGRGTLYPDARVHIDENQSITLITRELLDAGVPSFSGEAFPGDNPGTKRSKPFAEGDIVYLKSGSPPMTAEPGLRSDGFIAVAWFVGATLHRDAFHRDALTKQLS